VWPEIFVSNEARYEVIEQCTRFTVARPIARARWATNQECEGVRTTDIGGVPQYQVAAKEENKTKRQLRRT